MRPPKLKSTLATLRTTLDKGQREFAELIGCSHATVQSIELGRLALSKKLAEQISLQTGVNQNWLLSGRYKESPVTSDSPPRPYSKSVFEQRQADLARPRVDAADLDHMRQVLALGVLRISESLIEAYRNDRIILFYYRYRMMIEELEAEFGNSGDLAKALKPNKDNPNAIHMLKHAVLIRELSKLLEGTQSAKKASRAIGAASTG